jgi:hypothetical protein
VKHLILIVLVVTVVYVLWNLASPIERREGVRLMTRHALRLGSVLAAVLALLVLAYFVPSINIL